MEHRTGFELFNYWVQVHAIFSGNKQLTPRNFSGMAKKAFNSNFGRVKSVYRLDTEETKSAVLYAYVHNPLNLGSVAEYGCLTNLVAAIYPYTRWKAQNIQEVLLHGAMPAILSTAPKLCDLDKELLPYLEEMLVCGS